MQPTQDLNVREIVPLVSPRKMKAETPISETANRTVVDGREAVKRILDGERSAAAGRRRPLLDPRSRRPAWSTPAG